MVNFAAGGIATPADAALMMQLGAEGVFVGSGIFKSSDPARFARAIVQATTHYNDPARSPRRRVAWVSRCAGWRSAVIPREDLLAVRGELTAMDTPRPLRIGVLALQGGVAEHLAMLHKLGAEAVEVRLPEHLEGLDGIILPGGESTSIGKLMVEYGLLEPLRTRLQAGLPAYGTCAGMILLARDLGGMQQPLLGVMDIQVRRNAFGAQGDEL